jgi:tetratricopeptide (TPR) repeat protein
MKKNKSFGWVLLGAFVAVVLSSAWPVFAQNSELAVKCVDSSDAPAQNVKVTVVHLNTKKSKDKKSDVQGLAVFEKLENGVYRIFGHKEGVSPALFEYVILKDSKESVALKFAAGEDKKFYFEDPELERNAAALLKQGIEALNQNIAGDAEKFFSQSLAINPSASDTNFYYGYMLLRQSKFDEGTAALKKAISTATALKTLSSAAPAGKPNINEQIIVKAQEQIMEIPALKGDLAFRQKKYNESAVFFSEAIKNIPNRPDFYGNLARALTQAGKNDEALVAISKAMELKPDDQSYVTLKENIITRQKIAVIEKAQAIMNEGIRIMDAGDTASALQKFQEANGMIPPDKQAPLWRLIGRAQAKLNHPDEAEAAFKNSIALSPADKVADYQRSFAQFYLDIKKFEEAVDMMAGAKSAGSKSSEETLMELFTKEKDREPRLAEAALERVIKLNPENADAHYFLGRMYFSEGKANDKRTKELLTKFVAIGKDAEKLDDAKGLLYVVNKRNK